MQEPKQSFPFLTALSVVYVAGALFLLALVCGLCYPELAEKVRHVIGGWEGGTLQEAFGTLSEGLEAGLPVKETVEASIEVLIRDLA